MSNKVNANTKELEFKRKHNNLVDNVEELAEDLEEIPNVEEAESGTIVNALGLDSDGKLVKGTISGGTKLFDYQINAGAGPDAIVIHAFSFEDLQLISAYEVYEMLEKALKITFGYELGFYNLTYNGGLSSLQIKLYPKDSIDTTSGNFKSRTASSTSTYTFADLTIVKNVI